MSQPARQKIATLSAEPQAHGVRKRARVSSAGDLLEMHADRMAQAVLEGARTQSPHRHSITPRLGLAADSSAVLISDGTGVHALGLHPLSGSGEPLSPQLRDDLEAGFGFDFGSVRVHRDSESAQSAAVLHAKAYASGSRIVLGARSHQLSPMAMRELVTHELAHVVQQSRDPSLAYGAGVLIQRQPTDLSGIPQTERQAIQIGTTAVTVPAERITAFFTIMPSGRPSESRSVGATDSFATGIPSALRGGLSSIAAYIAGDTNALPLNSSIEVDLDLSAHGGAATTYRFTYFSHTTGSGRAATTANVMLIEQVGAILAAPVAQTAPSGAFTVGSTNLALSGRWADPDYTILHQALSLLPAAALSAAAGLTFRRVGGATGPEGGRYDSGSDTVELNNTAFPGATDLRIGQRPPAVRAVLHEVGHAIDLRILERAWQAFNVAGQSAAARRTLLAVRSPSGSRWGRQAGSTSTDEIQENPGDSAPAFRAAVQRDGVRRDTSGSRTTPEGTTATLSGGITTYSDTDYQELYAESFAMYVAAPQTLRQLRPATFAYFRSQFP